MLIRVAKRWGGRGAIWVLSVLCRPLVGESWWRLGFRFSRESLARWPTHPFGVSVEAAQVVAEKLRRHGHPSRPSRLAHPRSGHTGMFR